MGTRLRQQACTQSPWSGGVRLIRESTGLFEASEITCQRGAGAGHATQRLLGTLLVRGPCTTTPWPNVTSLWVAPSKAIGGAGYEDTGHGILG